MSGMPRVIVMGGSIGGLTAALVLRDAGCDVRVLERSSTELTARGAGIAALSTTLAYLVKRGGFRARDVCSATDWIRFLHRDGTAAFEQRHRYLFSSWNTIYRSLLGLFDADRYLLGQEVTDFRQAGDTVMVTLASGEQADGNLLVCADGVGSLGRERLAPAAGRTYAGYVAWRGTVPERDLSPGTRELLGNAITYQVLPGSHILVYPIPALDGSLTEGDRLINIVWYVNVPDGEPLEALMTGRDGIRRPVSLPPGTATGQAVAGMRQAADELLAGPIAEAIARTAEPFVQVVYDIEVSRMAFGRACLMGDAAFAVRPHAAAGTAKAAADGWALAEELTAAGGDVPAALAAWERRQLALGRSLLARCRDIGDSSQFSGTFRPGDPQLIFGLYSPGN
jgi:2,6-dihydroxypyridine 3-monooxygenase